MKSISFLLFAIVLSAVFGASPYRCSSYVLFSLFTAFCYGALPFHWMQSSDIESYIRIYFAGLWVAGVYAMGQLIFSLFGIYDPFCPQMIALPSATIVRPNAFAFEPSHYALAITPLAAYFNTLFILKEKGRSLRDILIVVAANTLLIFSTSTGGVFSYAFYCIFLVMAFQFKTIKRLFPGLKMKIRSFLILSISLVLFLNLFTPSLAEEFFFKYFYKGFSEHISFFERWITIVNAWSVFLEHPWFGVGLGGVGPYILEAYESGDGGILFQPRDLASFKFNTFDPENVNIEILASLGIFGAIAFALLLFYLIRLGARVMREGRIPKDCKIEAFALLISTLTLLATLQFVQGVLRSYVWVQFFLSAGFMTRLLRLYRQ